MKKVTVHFAGTGNAFNTSGYANQSIFVETEGNFLAIDAGPTFLYRIEQMGIPHAKINHILITHFHGDHIGGIPFQVINFAIFMKGSKLKITGPVGIEERIKLLMSATYPDVNCDESITFHELDVAIKQNIPLTPNIALDTYPMNHSPESLGYGLKVWDKKIAITGDTRWNDNIPLLMKGRDLGIMECTTLEKDEFSHISVEEFKEEFPRLKCTTLVPVHCGTDVREKIKSLNVEGIKVMEDGDKIFL